MRPAYFDSHCHLQDPRLEPSRVAVVDRALAAGVTHLVCCGTQEADWGRVLELAARHRSVIPMVGLHPWFASEASPGWAECLRTLLGDGAVGLGECGLDFAVSPCDREVQEQAFRIQLRLARDLNRPVAIHCRKAWARLLLLLEEEGVPTAGGLVHAFSGSQETAARLQALGLHLSFGGSLTWPAHAKAANALLGVSGNRLLLESDAPDMTPQGATGLNEPANLPLVAAAAARIRGEALTALAAQTHANAMMLFGGLMR